MHLLSQFLLAVCWSSSFLRLSYAVPTQQFTINTALAISPATKHTLSLNRPRDVNSTGKWRSYLFSGLLIDDNLANGFVDGLSQMQTTFTVPRISIRGQRYEEKAWSGFVGLRLTGNRRCDNETAALVGWMMTADDRVEYFVGVEKPGATTVSNGFTLNNVESFSPDEFSVGVGDTVTLRFGHGPQANLQASFVNRSTGKQAHKDLASPFTCPPTGIWCVQNNIVGADYETFDPVVFRNSTYIFRGQEYDIARPQHPTDLVELYDIRSPTPYAWRWTETDMIDGELHVSRLPPPS